MAKRSVSQRSRGQSRTRSAATAGRVRQAPRKDYAHSHTTSQRSTMVAGRTPSAQAPRKYRFMPVAITTAIFVIAIYVVLYASHAFVIKEVSVEGVHHLTSEEMTALASVPADTTLLNIDTSAIKESILRDSWVKDVRIHRKFPSTLVLDVTEREIAATVQLYAADGIANEIWALSQDGMWLCDIPAKDSERAQTMAQSIFEDSENVLRISDVQYGVVAEPGVLCADESILNALAIVDGLSTELKDDIITIKATSPESTTVILSSNVEIVFGTADDLRDKERICLKVLEDNLGKVAYINVSVPEKPTWRSIE